MRRWFATLAVVFAVSALAEEAPVSLTASDGAGLKLVSYTARAVVEDPLAFTELALVFENPRDTLIEGQFRVTLPRGAAVSRFAMKLDGRWQEGEVVEKQAARQAYEDFLHRRQDPALLEQAAGNEFSARVFPIAPRGRKELVISWSHELPSSEAPYVLPLKGLPLVGALEVEVFSAGASVASLKKEGFVPDRDVVVAPSRAGRTGVRAGDLVVTRVKAVAASTPEPLTSLLMLVDTSASRALGYTAQVALVQRLVERLAKANAALPLTIACFDQSVAVVHEGPAGGFGPTAVKAMRDRRALGASDLSGALKWALEHGKKSPAARLLLVSDGVFTAGQTEADELLAAVARLKDVGVARLDALAVGGIREEATLRRLVAARLPKIGAVLDGDAEVEVLTRRLSEATVAKVEVMADGAKVVWPVALEGVQAGDEAVVVLEAAGPAPRLRIGGAVLDLSRGLAGVERPLLQRAWAQARIQALLHQRDVVADGAAQKQSLRDEVIALSVKQRVLSPYTALLVLETEADYARFHIDRRALAEVLTVAKGRIAVLQRSAETLATSSPAVSSTPLTKSSAPERNKDGAATSRRPAPRSADARAAAPEAIGGGNSRLDAAAERQRGGADREMKKGMADGVPESEPAAGPGQASVRRDEAPQDQFSNAMGGSPAPPPPSAARPALPTQGPAPASPVPQPSLRRAEGFASGEEPREERSRRRTSFAPESDEQMSVSREPWEGPFKEVMVSLGARAFDKALDRAMAWREEAPGDVLALVALGEALEATGDGARAARAYGSIIDLFPGRADLRRFAGARLERIKSGQGLELAADTFAKAAEQRPDHPASHRLLAFALLRLGRWAEAFAAIEKGLAQSYPGGRFAGVDRILREDAGLIAAAWLKAQPGVAPELLVRLERAGGVPEQQPTLRFVLNWETDANDVDFHINDGRGGHAYYGQPELPSGGSLYADVTTGYGPECFTIRLPLEQRAYPYRLRAHYYSRGPMGYGMGTLQIIEHDGRGTLRFEERPFVVMVDQAYVDLGVVKR
jgi:tetratricopeptide (TPR) repeat protein